MIGRKWVIPGLLLSLVALGAFAAGPVPYVENKNQWPAVFRFGAEFPQTKVFLKDASIFFIQYSQINDDDKSSKRLLTKAPKESHIHSSGELAMATFELKFLNALQASISASGKHKTKYNYLYGNESSAWAQGASAYGEIIYEGIYAGIDLKVYSAGNQMKYDWIVSPCADVRKIAFTYHGVENLELRDENLVIESKLGEVVETKPYAYQIVNGERRVVPAAFEIDNQVVTFVFPEGYDSNYELVIDPFLIFSGYSGSTLDNWGNTSTPDSHGNLYSGGMVLGPETGKKFPTTAGAYQTTHHGGQWDVGILKYDSIGANLLYVTYLGGEGVETPQSLVVNSNDELLILGATSSDDFPGTSGGFKGGFFVDPLNGVDYNEGTDLFIAKLSVDGTHLLKSTYLGGTSNDGINFVSGDMGTQVKTESILSRNYGDQLRGDIITASDGSVYIASNTRSTDFPIVNADGTVAFNGGTHDAVIAKLAPDLSVVWTRLIGGTGTDVAYSIKISESGNIFAAGGTASNDLIGIDGLITSAPGGGGDGWIVELSPDGDEVVHGTYVGTTSYDQVYFMDIATNGDVLAYGQTMGAYPVTPATVYSNANGGQFLHRFTPDLKSTVFSTTFGKGGHTPDISPTAFLVNACDNIFMAGWGGTVNAPFRGVQRNYVGGDTQGLPVTPDAWQKTSFGNDFYFMVLTADASKLVYATFLGGTTSPTHVDGGTSRFDKRGIVYHAVCAGCGGFPDDFPSYHVPDARSRNGSENCNNAAFKFDLSSLRAGVQSNATQTGSNTFRLCLPANLILQNQSVGGEIFEWKFGDGEMLTVDNKNSVVHTFKKPGRYEVQLKAIDHTTCIGEDSTVSIVEVFLSDMHAGPDQDICFGSSTRLETFGGASFAWKTADNLYTSNESKPLVAPEKNTNYYVTMTDAGGCVRKDTVVVNVVPGIDVKFDYQEVFDCQNRSYVKVQNLSELKDGEEARFLFGDGTSSGETEAVHTYERDGKYTISLQATKEFCVYQVSEEIAAVTLKIPNVITPGAEDGLNDSFKLVYGDPPLPKTDLNIGIRIMDRWGVGVFESKHYTDDWRGENLSGGLYYYEVELLDDVRCKGWIHLIK